MAIFNNPRFSMIFKCELLVYIFMYDSRADWENKPYQDVCASYYDALFGGDFLNPNFPPLDDE